MSQNHCAEVLAALQEGLEATSATGEHVWDAELLRLRGVVLLAENKVGEGQASLEEAFMTLTNDSVEYRSPENAATPITETVAATR